MLLERYNPVVYANLKEVDEVDKEVSEDEIRAVMNVILEHGYGDKLCVMTAHKHHDLADNEAMMVKNRTSGSDPIVSTPAPLEQIAKKGAKPNAIVLGGDGQRFYPVNYAPLDEKDVQAWSDLKFLNAIATLLMEKGLGDKLMLGIKTWAPDVKFIEWNYPESRSSELRPLVDGIMPADAIKTAYGFNYKADGNGNMVPVMGCVVICYNCGPRVHR